MFPFLASLELSANPIANSGIEAGAFDDMATLYLRIAEAKLTAVPKGKNYVFFNESQETITPERKSKI